MLKVLVAALLVLASCLAAAAAEDAALLDAAADATTAAPAAALFLPAGLCSRVAGNFHTRFVDRAGNRTFFFSVALCGNGNGGSAANDAASAPVALTPADKAASTCLPAAARFRIVAVAGTGAALKDDTCGATSDFFVDLAVLNVTTPAAAAGGENAEVLALGLYHNVSVEGKGKASTAPLTLLLACNTSAAEFTVTDVRVYDPAANVIVVTATANCAAPAEKEKSRTAFIVALILVFLGLFAFAGVLWRAKKAGDRLREIKKKRGERVYLG
jgi:hypothetical protein